MAQVYMTKYALTKGIQIVGVVEEKDSELPDYFYAVDSAGVKHWCHGEGREWCRTFTEAKAVAEDMRKKKIASLKKQIKRIEGLTFTKPAGE